LAFGGLHVAGMVVRTRPRAGAMVGNLQLQVTKSDGTPFRLSIDPTKETADDLAVRKLLAFLELTAPDLFSAG
jgi:hypothetical protein